VLRRAALTSLESWARSARRKPLVLLGARQVGKTFLLKHFGKKNFSTAHYFNFEERSDLAKLFEQDLTPQRIVQELEIKFDCVVKPGTDLLIFDEIQECPRALTSLKYFSEKFPELAVCAAGSLLGLELNSSSFPVGNVHLLDLHPMSFAEFVEALGGSRLMGAFMSQINPEEFSDAAHSELWRLLKLYFICGGLPSNVNLLVEQSATHVELLSLLRSQQQQLVRNYLADMAKHCGKVNAMHLERVFRAIPTQLAQVQDASTQRFKFSGVVPGISQYTRLVSAFDWLSKAGLAMKVPVIEKPLVPLLAQVKESRMKVFPLDIGLLGSMAGIEPSLINSFEFGTYKGFFAECFVAQELRAAGTEMLYSWQEGQAEVEFVVEYGGSAIPLEVKSGKNTRSRSLQSYVKRYAPPSSFILSAKPLTKARSAGTPHMLPLYLAARWRELAE
jgi:predicted AAA+ superfamily ATPase